MSTADGMELAETRPYASYVERLAQSQIPYQHCQSCGTNFFYPRVLCPDCGSIDVIWACSAGKGVVYAVTSVAQRDAEPYVVCLIDVDEGFRMMSTVLHARDVRIGDSVHGHVEPVGDDYRVVFEPEVQ